MEGLMLPFNKEGKEYILSKNLWHSPLPLGAEARFDCLIDRETHTTRKQCLMTSLIMTHTETNTARAQELSSQQLKIDNYTLTYNSLISILSS